jgi:FkbM family methyltransferase
MPFSLFPRLRELRLPAPVGVMQVGASYGQEMKEFLDNGIRCGVFIEPLPEPFEHLSALCKQIPNFMAVNTLCTDFVGGKHTFHVASNGGMSSSILPPSKHLLIYDNIKFPNAIELVSSTVDQVVATMRHAGHGAVIDNIDLLYMDTQGAEYRILLGANGLLPQIKYIYTEVMRGELYQNQVPFLAYCSHLDAIGFTLNDVHFSFPEQAGNALFIRKDVVGL